MQIFLNYFSNGIRFLLLYFCTLFLLPIIFVILDYTQVTSNPIVFGQDLFNIQVDGNHFVSEGTAFGALLAFTVGLVIYFLFLSVFKRKSQQT
ncbi:hypothetical protein [Priestia megaterium]|uniref:hypothetical protein n=1 Tax=Priestia megaterium TaxID=1404 RepID=UPI000BFA02B2|nr:hypothetical protein [Priestia megaterium]PFR87905.1 hypothetical protein COK39_27490 [Priestia megaterium]